MRYWSLGFLAIALLAGVIALRDDTAALTVARVVFGIALLLFAIVIVYVGRRSERGEVDAERRDRREAVVEWEDTAERRDRRDRRRH